MHTLSRFLMLACFCAVMLVASVGDVQAEARGAIGFVKAVTGDAEINRDGSVVNAEMGQDLFMGDTIVTDGSSTLGITFMDSGMVSIGPDTVYVIDEFVFQPREKKLSFISSMSKGTLQFVSGNIAKIAPESVKVKTPEGTIGVRGTRFLIKVED